MSDDIDKVISNPTYQDSIVNEDSNTPLLDDTVIGEISPGGGSSNDGNISTDKKSFKEQSKENWIKFDNNVTKVANVVNDKRISISNGVHKVGDNIKKIGKDLDSSYNSSVQDLQNKINNIKAPQVPGNGMLSNSLNKVISGFVDNLFTKTSESFGFLANSASVFAKGLLDKAMNVLMSNVFVPENVYLKGLQALQYLNADYRTRNDIIRIQCIKHDYAKALQWINEYVGIVYTNTNNIALGEGRLAAKNGAIRVVNYIMGELYKEETVYDDFIFYNEKNPNTDPKLIKEAKNVIRKSRLNLHILLKELIIGSFSHLEAVKNEGPNNVGNSLAQITAQVTGMETVTLSEIVNNYKLKPSALGTSDKEFGGQAQIKPIDLNKFVPFWKKPKPVTNTIGFEDNAIQISTQTKTSGSFIADVGSLPIMSRAPFNNIPQEYIVPRNANIKQIYIYLTCEKIHGKNVLDNKPLYERLKYPFYDDFLELADKSLAGFFQTGLGTLFNTNVTVDSVYLYARKMESLIYSPEKTVFLKVQDLSELPEPKGVSITTTKPTSQVNTKQPSSTPVKIQEETFTQKVKDNNDNYTLEYTEWIESIIINMKRENVIVGSEVQKFTGTKYMGGVPTQEYINYLITIISYIENELNIEIEFGLTDITYTIPSRPYVQEPEIVIQSFNESEPIYNVDGSYTKNYIEWVQTLIDSMVINNTFENYPFLPFEGEKFTEVLTSINTVILAPSTQYVTYLESIITYIQEELHVPFILGSSSIVYEQPKYRIKKETFKGVINENGTVFKGSKTNPDGSISPDYISWVREQISQEYILWLEKQFYYESEPNHIFEGTKYKFDGTFTNEFLVWVIKKLDERNFCIGSDTIKIYTKIDTINKKTAPIKYKGVKLIDWTKVDIDDPILYEQIVLELFNLDYGYNFNLIYVPNH